MLPKYDLSGKRFTRLLVIRFHERVKPNKTGLWECLCDCGRTVFLDRSYFYGKVFSCGCLQREGAIKRFTKHGETSSPEHEAWTNIKQRCLNPKNKGYKNYGGRGIMICENWKNSFENFLYDMGKRPTDKHSIDRINNDGNYEPYNCRWATKIEQSLNKRTSSRITFNGETKSAKEWSKQIGITEWALLLRLRSKYWTFEDALTLPKKRIGNPKTKA